MGKIFCLMGKSSSGKDTIFKKLIGDNDLNLKPIITYTTRPLRKGETNGLEYFFVDNETLKNFENQGKVIEKREYNSTKGKWYYFIVEDDQINLSENNYILVVTLEAYKSLQNYFGMQAVVPIYITLDDGVRLERAVKREREQANPKYDELCRRFLVDNIDFSKEKLEACGISKHYYNYNLEECFKEIKEDISTKHHLKN